MTRTTSRFTRAMTALLAGALFPALAAAQAAPETGADRRSDLDWAQVRYVVVKPEQGGTYRFDVTVEHHDEGWDHYADRWQVVDPETHEVYGERVLLHPHDDEQPFTRSERGITIPEKQTTVLVRARCTKHGYEGRAVLVDLTKEEGEDYEIRS